MRVFFALLLSVACSSSRGDLLMMFHADNAGSTVVFTGEGLATADGVLSPGDMPGYLLDPTIMLDGSATAYPLLTGGAALINMTTTQQVNVTGVLFNDSTGLVGWDVDADFNFSIGDEIRFSATESTTSVTVNFIDPNELAVNAPMLPFTSSGDLGLPQGRIIFSGRAAVPEPSAMLYGLAIALSSVVWCRVRHRASGVMVEPAAPADVT